MSGVSKRRYVCQNLLSRSSQMLSTSSAGVEADGVPRVRTLLRSPQQ